VLYSSSHHRTIRLVLTRYQSTVIIPKFSSLLSLSSLQNLHTLQVFHAHSQMTTAIKDSLQGVELSQIRTLIIPGHCHEILKCCPEVTKVWCNRGDGSKLVTIIAKYNKKVQEMRGFSTDEKLVKSALIYYCKRSQGLLCFLNTVLQELSRQLLICVFCRYIVVISKYEFFSLSFLRGPIVILFTAHGQCSLIFQRYQYDNY
jgi:hypothetical protein